MRAVAVGVSGSAAEPQRTPAQKQDQQSSGVCGRWAMKHGFGIREQRSGMRLIVLPRVRAVAEKKPCGSVGREAGEKKTNTGVSPLRCAPVEMTTYEEAMSAPVEITGLDGDTAEVQQVKANTGVSPLRGSAAAVEMTSGVEIVAEETKAGPSPTAQNDKTSIEDDKAGSAEAGGERGTLVGQATVEVAFYRK